MVVDEWPLVRLGVVHALRADGIRIVAETHLGEEGVRQAQALEATYLLLGAVRDATIPDLVHRALTCAVPPKVVVLLDHVSRDELAEVVSFGVDALLVRSLQPDELLDALARVSRGERVVGPRLMSLLVGLLGPAEDADPEPVSGADGPLTRKEIEVLARLAEGRSNREIADALFVTPATVKTHLGHIYNKLGVDGRQAAVAEAVAQGLLR